MPDFNYMILEIPRHARNVAASRMPRLQSSVPAEFADNWISPQVASGVWNIDPSDGQPINDKGQTLEVYLEAMIKSRPHWLLPETPVDPNETTWSSGNITLQAARLKQIRATTNTDAEALAQLTEEAAEWGVKPFSTVKGEKLDPKAPRANDRKPVSASNPWGAIFVKANGIDAAYLERERLMKTLGLTKCAGFAAAAGLTITGAPLKKG